MNGSAREPEIVVLDDAEAVAFEASERFARAARLAIAARGGFAVALSGGKTPLRAFQLLARRTDLEWPRVEIFFVDERAVPPTHPDSNFRMTDAALLRPAGIPAERVRHCEESRTRCGGDGATRQSGARQRVTP